MKLLLKGLCFSFCAYPAIVFWLWIAIPISLTCCYGMSVVSGEISLSNLPLEYYFLLIPEIKLFSQVASFIQTLTFIQVYYSIRRYIKKCMTHAAPRASIKFKTYYNIVIYPIYINIISSFLLCFVTPKSSSLFTIHPLNNQMPNKYTVIYIILYFLSYGCELSIIYIYNRVYTIMEGDLRPNGWVADIFICLGFLINFIALIEETCFHTKSWLLIIAPWVRLIWGWLSSFKRIIVTIGVNGNKFIKVPEELLY